MAKKAERPHYLGRSKLEPLAVGTRVVLKRPNLWAGMIGFVESYYPDTTIHVIKIRGWNGKEFHADATRECLEVL
jgi:hypothetical protein